MPEKMCVILAHAWITCGKNIPKEELEKAIVCQREDCEQFLPGPPGNPEVGRCALFLMGLALGWIDRRFADILGIIKASQGAKDESEKFLEGGGS